MFLRMQDYQRPNDLMTALRLLARPGYRPLAGGTAAVGPVNADTIGLVDLSGLPLRFSRLESAGLVLGAMTPLEELLELPELLLAGGGVLGRAVERTGPPSLLARATLGGSLARPGRAPELVTALLALGATATVVRLHNSGLVRDIREVGAIPRGGLIECITIPTNPVHAGYERVSRTPRDLPAVAVVAAVALGGGGFVKHVRIAACGVAPRPVRLAAAEAVLEGAAPIAAVLGRAAEAAAAAVKPPSDLRGSAEYRRHLAGVLTRRALAAAIGPERM